MREIPVTVKLVSSPSIRMFGPDGETGMAQGIIDT